MRQRYPCYKPGSFYEGFFLFTPYLTLTQSRSTISNTRYIELFLFSPFSTLGNCSYIFVRYLEPRYVELFPRSLQRFLDLFSIRYPEHFYFTHSNDEIICSKTLIVCLSFLISTQQHVGQAKV